MKPPVLFLTPAEFEREVRNILDAQGSSLTDYESKHLDVIAAPDGEYVFDVTARFSALGAAFLVLVECKHHRRPVERADVQVLHAKVASVGAQKAMVFSVSGFQSGAVEYATAHGIALVQLQDECTSYFARSFAAPEYPPTGKVIGWLHRGKSVSLVSAVEGKYMMDELRRPTVSAQQQVAADDLATGASSLRRDRR